MSDFKALSEAIIKGDINTAVAETQSTLDTGNSGQDILDKGLIERPLCKTGGNRTKAAKILEISRPILISKIKEYQLD